MPHRIISIRVSTLSLSLLALLLVTSLATAQQDAAPSPEEATALVEALASPQFAVRQQAFRKLYTMGLSAQAALEAGAASDDREVSSRCRNLLDNVYLLDQDRRLQLFIHDELGEDEKPLAGWIRFSELVGDDEQTRKLFSEMYEREQELLEACEESPEKASALVAEHCAAEQANYRITRQQPDHKTILTWAFLASGDSNDLPIQNANTVVNYCNQLIDEANNSNHGEAYKKILGSFMLAQRKAPNITHALIGMGCRLEVPEVLVISRDALTGKMALHPLHKAAALMAIAEFGTEEDADLLEDCFQSERVCVKIQRDNVRCEIQFRDVALACWLHLAGEDLKDYGMENVAEHPSLLFNTSTLGFLNPEARTAAFAKWEEYVAEKEAATEPPE